MLSVDRAVRPASRWLAAKYAAAGGGGDGFGLGLLLLGIGAVLVIAGRFRRAARAGLPPIDL